MTGEAQITFVGHVGKDPELKFTPAGHAVCTMSVAVTERVKDGDGWKDGETIWFRVTSWRQAGEGVAEHVKKGDRVTVSGKFKLSTYEKDGEKRAIPEVTSDTVGIIPKALTKNSSREQSEETPW